MGEQRARISPLEFINTMWWRIIGIIMSIFVLGVSYWVTRTEKRLPAPLGYWASTDGGCYVPVNAPKTAAPGPVCGTTSALPYCVFQGRQYAPTERFSAGDGCNSCECNAETMTVECTNSACVNTNANVPTDVEPY